MKNGETTVQNGETRVNNRADFLFRFRDYPPLDIAYEQSIIFQPGLLQKECAE